MPILKTKSYLEWIKRPYKRLAGFGNVKNDDVVVFNFPGGDTVVTAHPERSYYSVIRDYAKQLEDNDARYDRPLKTWEEYLVDGRQSVWNDFDIVSRPVDKRDNYIKRCVAIPGDTLLIVKGKIHINGKPIQNYEGAQHRYLIRTNGTPINPKAFERLNIARSDQEKLGNEYHLPLTEEAAEKLRRFTNVISVSKYEYPENEYNYQIFPHDTLYKWTLDNFGPLWMPTPGTTIPLTLQNLPLYRRIIEGYEGNIVKVQGDQISINGEPVREYTFKQGYYFMIGDNRHSSSDCRYWGYVPEDHILGKPKFIWLSLDEDKRFLAKIRWKRMFLLTDKV